MKLPAGLLLLSLVPGPPAKTGYALRGVRVLDVVSGRYSPPSVVLVTGTRIDRILPDGQYTPALADSTIDLTGKYLLPGLIDAHVHLSLAGTIRANALATLQAGFTTVADLGARGTRVLRFRDSVNAGPAPGPRILAAGLWVGIQGGVCEFNGIGISGGVEGFKQRIAENVQAGADLIKLCVSGWPAESFANPGKYELSDSILSASVTAAHAAGKLVIAHDLSEGGVRAGLRAGVDGLAHAAYLDSALALEMKRRNVFLVPTLASLTGGDSSQASRALIDAVRLAHRAGVPIVFGTDAGVIRHGDNAIEFSALQGAGLIPLDAIRAATINAARALRLADSVGTVNPGMVADLVILNADPLQDVAALRSPALVFARGKPVLSTQAKVREELERAYAANQKGFLEKNVDAIMALRTPDFHTVGPDGSQRDWEAMRLYTVGFLNGIDRWIELTMAIDSLDVQTDQAIVTMKQHLDRMALREDGKVHHVETWATQREIWKRTPDGWKLWQVDQVRDQRGLIDGKPE